MIVGLLSFVLTKDEMFPRHVDIEDILEHIASTYIQDFQLGAYII